MPRPLRHFEPGALYHVTQRGNAQKDIFFSDADREHFLALMQEGVRRFGHRIHAYCLMSNHVHLLVQAGANPISKAMQNLAFRHARYLNRIHETTGHRFQGRYFASTIQDETYLTEVLKYIHLNPVRAAMVSTADEYLWSSHHDYAGVHHTPWLTTHFCLQQFSDNLPEAIAGYAQYLDIPQSPETLNKIDTFSHKEILMSDRFIDRVDAKANDKIVLNHLTIDAIIRETCRYCDIELTELTKSYSNKRSVKGSNVRGLLGVLLLNHTPWSLTELAKYTHTSLAAVSRSRRKMSESILSDSSFAKQYAYLLNYLVCMDKAKQKT